MKRILSIILALVLIGLLISWWLGRPSAIEKEVRAHFWTLVQLEVDGEEVALPSDASITLKPMGGRRYVGSASVNSYEVHFVIKGDGKFSFTNEGGGVTEMAGLPHLMAIEETYIAALWKIRKAEVSGSTLVLTGPGVQLSYEGKPAPPLDDRGSPDDTVSTTAAE
jgi:heat shock protein HslJ